MRLRLPICADPCLHLRQDHHGGSGHCAKCSCMRFKKARGTGNKYGAKRRDGCDSSGEAERWQALLLLQAGGYISELRRHESINVEPPGSEPIRWRIDYVYIENGALIHEDFKSEATYGEAARIKSKLLLARGERLRISYRERSGRIVVQDLAGSARVAFARRVA